MNEKQECTIIFGVATVAFTLWILVLLGVFGESARVVAVNYWVPFPRGLP